MSKYRGTDGRIQDDELAKRATRLVTPPDDPERGVKKTAAVDNPAHPRPDGKGVEGHTRLAGLPDFVAQKGASPRDADLPVVGWLVIVDGPGKGNSLTLGYGLNDLARSSAARVPLDFGDEEIARNQHAIVTFDPRSRRFFVQHGAARNLTYLDNTPLLAAQEMSSGQEISLGQTRLRFVALCGADFDWKS